MSSNESAYRQRAVGKTCPACGKISDLMDAKYSVQDRFALSHCANCGLGALDIQEEDDGEFDEYWTEVNQRIYGEASVLAELSRKYNRYYRMALAKVPNKRFLDVGSGAGASISTAAEMGFEVTGVEPSANAVALSRRLYKLPVIQGLLHADDALPRDYGMLALWDVIEHVNDPQELVRACNLHLAPDGLFLLETPDEGALLRRIFRFVGRTNLSPKDPRKSIYYRAHRFYFTRTAMTRLLERSGFTDISFYGERTMYQKELRKKQLYDGVSPFKAAMLKVVFFTLKHMPFMANKMVVVAVKAAVPAPALKV